MNRLLRWTPETLNGCAALQTTFRSEERLRTALTSIGDGVAVVTLKIHQANNTVANNCKLDWDCLPLPSLEGVPVISRITRKRSKPSPRPS